MLFYKHPSQKLAKWHACAKYLFNTKFQSVVGMTSLGPYIAEIPTLLRWVKEDSMVEDVNARLGKGITSWMS